MGIFFMKFSPVKNPISAQATTQIKSQFKLPAFFMNVNPANTRQRLWNDNTFTGLYPISKVGFSVFFFIMGVVLMAKIFHGF